MVFNTTMGRRSSLGLNAIPYYISASGLDNCLSQFCDLDFNNCKLEAKLNWYTTSASWWKTWLHSISFVSSEITSVCTYLLYHVPLVIGSFLLHNA